MSFALDFEHRRGVQYAAGVPPLCGEDEELGAICLRTDSESGAAALASVPQRIEGVGSLERGTPSASARLGRCWRISMELKAVSSSNQLGRLSRVTREPSLPRILKWKVELTRAIGADRLVAPSAGTEPAPSSAAIVVIMIGGNRITLTSTLDSLYQREIIGPANLVGGVRSVGGSFFVSAQPRGLVLQGEL
jgi:hypothetical protein